MRRLNFKAEISGSTPASAFSLSDVGDAFQFIKHIAERRRNTTGQSGVGVRRWRSKAQIDGSLSNYKLDVATFQLIKQVSKRR